MKKTIFKALALFACTMAFAACTQEMEWKDAAVTAPGELFGPTEAKVVELQASATAALVFEWENSFAEDGGAPMYEVVFSKDSNFDTPLYSVAADLGGTLNKATISHKDLNKIAGLAGGIAGEQTKLSWTVFAYRGLSKAQASQVNTINLIRFFGFDELPGALYVTNPAEDAAVICASPESGVFEVFVKLAKDQVISLNSKADGTGQPYYIMDGKLYDKEIAEEYKVEAAGVYRIYFDFNIASMNFIKQIDRVCMNFCGITEYDLPYAGNGVFQGTHAIEWRATSWGRDERYKFWMFYSDGGRTNWGTKNGTDSRPNVNGAVDDSNPYFFTAETENTAYDQQKWKLDTWTDTFNFPDAKTKISLVFNVANYTHRIEKAN